MSLKPDVRSGPFEFPSAAGHCDYSIHLQSDVHPVQLDGFVSLDIVENEIFVDWSKFASDICFTLTETERISGPSHMCGYTWQSPNLALIVTVPFTDRQLGYSVENIAPNPVPEPASWALMIAGIGIVGANLRRRQTYTSPLL